MRWLPAVYKTSSFWLKQSANKAPVNIVGEDWVNVIAERDIFFGCETRVDVDNLAGIVASELYYLAVLCEVWDAQIESNTALLSAFHVARAA